MTSTLYTYEDIIAIRQKLGKGKLFIPDHTKITDSKNKDDVIQSYYIGLKGYNLKTDKYDIPYPGLRLRNAVTAAHAKVRSGSDMDKVKDTMILFKHLTEEDLNRSIKYGEQKKKLLLSDLELLLQALNIISEDYEVVAQELILLEEEGKAKFSFFQTGKQDVKTINNFVQKERKASKEETEKDRKTKSYSLETPLIRIKLPGFTYPINGKTECYICSWNYKEKKSKDILFNWNEMVKLPKEKMTKIPAKISINGYAYPYNINNAGEFITYLSTLVGTIGFTQISIHKFGLSLGIQFNELIVDSHPKIQGTNGTDENDLNALFEMSAGDMMNELVNTVVTDNDENIVLPKPSGKKKPITEISNQDDDKDNFSDNE